MRSPEKKNIKIFWLAAGKKDFLVPPGRTIEAVELLKKYGFNPEYKETDGGHDWNNWRNYLHEFAQQLFK